MHRYIYLIYHNKKIVGWVWLKKDLDPWLAKQKDKGIKGIKVKKILFSKWKPEKES